MPSPISAIFAQSYRSKKQCRTNIGGRINLLWKHYGAFSKLNPIQKFTFSLKQSRRSKSLQQKRFKQLLQSLDLSESRTTKPLLVELGHTQEQKSVTFASSAATVGIKPENSPAKSTGLCLKREHFTIYSSARQRNVAVTRTMVIALTHWKKRQDMPIKQPRGRLRGMGRKQSIFVSKTLSATFPTTT